MDTTDPHHHLPEWAQPPPSGWGLHCYSMLFNAIQLLLHATPCYSVLFKCYPMLFSATQCYSMLLHAIQCYSVLLNATQCYSIGLSPITPHPRPAE